MSTQPMEINMDNPKVSALCRSHEDANDHDRFRDDPVASGIVAVFPDLTSGQLP